MQCENAKCKKEIQTNYSCNKCVLKFCSNTCMIDHYFDSHQNNSESDILNKSALTLSNLKKLNRKSSIEKINSSFLKKGMYLREVRIFDNYFKFENFEKVKMGKKTHVLGAGAFGDVYLVKHKKDGKFFAVKQMNKQKILSTGAKLDIVRREIDIHSRLVHENIIRLHSYYEDAESFYLILEYANSGTLYTATKKNKGFGEEKAFKYFIQTASAIFFLHEQNLIHRDIKPENLLIDEDDNIRLCDFGWCIEHEIGNRNTFCGTIEYMAPEVIKELPYDRSIDVWSLGVLLYELLHGYSPFRAKNPTEEAEYTEVFKNITRYKFKIDKTEISENCKDLINKLLTSEISSRLKVKDIFYHPWVISFDKEIDSNNIKSQEKEAIDLNKSDLSGNNNIANKRSLDLQNFLNKIKEQTVEKNPNPNPNPNQSEIKPKYSNKSSNLLEENREKILENLNYQKLTSLQLAMNSTNELSYSEQDKTHSLFDKVLTQVKERNKDKRKKSRLETASEIDVESIIKNDPHFNHLNQRINVSAGNRDKSADTIRKIPSREYTKQHDGKLLNEIKQIEQHLDNHLLDQRKKFASLKEKTEDLNKLNNLNSALLAETKPKIINEEKKQSLIITKIEEIKNKNLNLKTISNESSDFKDESALTAITAMNNTTVSNTDTKYKKPPLNPLKKKASLGGPNTSSSNYNEILYGGKGGRDPRESRDSHKNPKNSAGSRPKDLSRELDMSFLPKDLLYTDNNYQESSKNLLSAIELLEKAQENKKAIDKENKENKSFWHKMGNFLNPFKCGSGGA